MSSAARVVAWERGACEALGNECGDRGKGRGGSHYDAAIVPLAPRWAGSTTVASFLICAVSNRVNTQKVQDVVFPAFVSDSVSVCETAMCACLEM